MFCSSASCESAIVGSCRLLLIAFCTLGERVEECMGRSAHSLVALKNSQRAPNRAGRAPSLGSGLFLRLAPHILTHLLERSPRLYSHPKSGVADSGVFGELLHRFSHLVDLFGLSVERVGCLAHLGMCSP